MADELLNACLRKQPYKTVEAATARLVELKAGPNVVDPERLVIYPCSYCGAFHLGHLPV